MGLYRTATSEIQINGFRSNSIPIERSICQGCPLSMLLYAICINNLLQTLDEEIRGVKTGNGKSGTAAVAYADDITILLTRPEDIPKLHEILDTYQKASGASVNMDKSRAMAIGEWNETMRIMNIPYYKELKILGFTFESKSNTTNKEQWRKIISQVRAIAQDAYYRKLDLDMRIRYVHDYLLGKIWHTSQILPITAEGVRQLNSTVAWYIWRGETFRVPLSTLHRSVDEGGWNRINIWAKSRALFVLRLRAQGQREGTPTADWLKKRNISTGIQNPLYFGHDPATLGYIREYIKDAAYIQNPSVTESTRTYKKDSIHNTTDDKQCGQYDARYADHQILATNRVEKCMENLKGHSGAEIGPCHLVQSNS